MKFVNRELLVSKKFNPPKNDFEKLDFMECGKTIGAGLDYNSLAGVVLGGNEGSVWGISISYFERGRWVDDDNIKLRKIMLGCNLSDGKYAFMSVGKLLIDFVGYDDNVMIVRVNAKRRTRVRLEAYSYFDDPKKFYFDDSTIRGVSNSIKYSSGELFFKGYECGYKNRFHIIDKSVKEYFYAMGHSKPVRRTIDSKGNAFFEFVVTPNSPLIFHACVTKRDFDEFCLPEQSEVEKEIDELKLNYFSNKCYGNGQLGNKAEVLNNICMWNRVYFPYYCQNMYLSSRVDVTENYLFNPKSDALSLITNAYLCDNDILAQCVIMMKNENYIPILAAYSLLKRGKSKDKEEWFFENVKNEIVPSGTIVVVSETPNETDGLINDVEVKTVLKSKLFYSLHKSCIKALSMELMAKIAEDLNKPEAVEYRQAYETLKIEINNKFYNADRKAYFNVDAHGNFNHMMGINCFMPLIAGVVDSDEKLEGLVSALKDSKLFGSSYIVRSMSRKAIMQSKKNFKNERINRRTFNLSKSISPYMNYAIYLGLLRYNQNEEASKLSAHCGKLFDNVYRYSMRGLIYRIFNLLWYSSKRNKVPSLDNSLFALSGMQSLLDVEYFTSVSDNAIRFGTFERGENGLSNIIINGKRYSITIRDLLTHLVENDVLVFKGEGGKFVVRNYRIDDDAVKFDIFSRSNIIVNLNIVEKSIKTSFTVQSGAHRVTVSRNDKIDIEQI